MNNVQKLIELSRRATVLVVDNGPLLSDWITQDEEKDSDNVIIEASWDDGEGSQVCTQLAEADIDAGFWDGHVFCCDDCDGNPTRFAFFQLVSIGPKL